MSTASHFFSVSSPLRCSVLAYPFTVVVIASSFVGYTIIVDHSTTLPYNPYKSIPPTPTILVVKEVKEIPPLKGGCDVVRD